MRLHWTFINVMFHMLLMKVCDAIQGEGFIDCKQNEMI